ncbi:hypothetical protein Tco_0000361 [Tanacetum coccineum]
MSSITTQQTKLDLELVPKEKRLEIGKCNGRHNPGKKQREPTFQVVLDALALTLCYFAFLITADVPEICLRVHGQNFDELPTNEDIVSFFKELGHTGEINTITDIVVDLMHQPWRTFATIINRSLSGKTTGVTPPKKARKFKKPASPKLSTVLASPEEPTRKSKRVKRPAKKSSDAPTAGVVIRETPVKSLSKKEKMTVEKRKGIDLLSEVALTEEAQYEEVRKKSLWDIHKTHPSGSGTVTKIAPSAAKIKPSVTNEGTGVKLGVPDVTKEESTESEAESWGKDEDDNNNDHDTRSEGSDHEKDSSDDNTQSNSYEEEKDDESVKTPSNSTDDEDETNDESKVQDKAEGDEDEGMNYTTNQFDDDVNVRLNEPVDIDEGFIHKEGNDAEMINVQQGNENPEILINQVIEDAHVTISTVPKKTEVLVTSFSHSSDLASKFLNFLDIPHTEAEIVSPLDVPVHHEVLSNQTPTLLRVPFSVITESSLVYTTVIPQSLSSFTPPPPQSTPTPPPTTEATNPPSALPNFTLVF